MGADGCQKLGQALAQGCGRDAGLLPRLRPLTLGTVDVWGRLILFCRVLWDVRQHPSASAHCMPVVFAHPSSENPDHLQTLPNAP